jgi:hypothetical protein
VVRLNSCDPNLGWAGWIAWRFIVVLLRTGWVYFQYRSLWVEPEFLSMRGLGTRSHNIHIYCISILTTTIPHCDTLSIILQTLRVACDLQIGIPGTRPCLTQRDVRYHDPALGKFGDPHRAFAERQSRPSTTHTATSCRGHLRPCLCVELHRSSCLCALYI